MDGDAPASPAKSYLIEVDKKEFTPEKSRPMPQVLSERLNSPSKKSTPEEIKSRHQSAERRRLSFNEEKVQKAHEEVKKVEEVRRKRTLEKENATTGQ